MPRYFIQLSYNGARYNGWQMQQNTPHTIQQVLQEKLGMILNEPLDITGCGRTDTGVHARDYYAHFDSVHPGLAGQPAQMLYKFNQVLPSDIALSRILPVTDEAHSRFDASSRSYQYLLHQHKDPFLAEYSCQMSGAIDFEAMNQAAAQLLTVTDFTSFSKVNTQTKTNNCRIGEARWVQLGPGRWEFRITADRFLRNMVRAIVGTLFDIGRGKLTLEEFNAIIADKNRSSAGISAPAHALYLTHIIYPDHLFL